MPALAGQRTVRRRQESSKALERAFAFSAPARASAFAAQAKLHMARQPSSDKAALLSASETASTSSADSKSSVLTMFKKGVLEAGDLLKKRQQMLSEKVQSGLLRASAATKMVTSVKASGTAAAETKDTRLKDDVLVDKADASAAGPVAAKSKESTNRAWIDTLERMGFDRFDIQEAMTMLGQKAKQIDDVVEKLVAMRANSMDPSSSGGSSSSDCFLVGPLKRIPGDSLGISVDVSSFALRIDGLSNGLVSRWNASHATFVQAKVGDIINEVNGIRGSGQVLYDLLMRPSVTLSIKAASITEGASIDTALAVPVEQPKPQPADGMSDTTEDVISLSGSAVFEVEPDHEEVVEQDAGGVVFFEQVSIVDFAAEIVESAFLQAAQVVEAEFAKERLLLKQERMQPKHRKDECPCKSPVRGGA